MPQGKALSQTYNWGIPTEAQAYEFINELNKHIDNVYAVQRDLGRPQGTNQVALALQILINFKVVNYKRHRLSPIAIKTISENINLLPEVIHDMYHKTI